MLNQQLHLLRNNMLKKLIICMASVVSLAIYSLNVPATVSYIQETPEDIQEALINIKERVPSETTIRTLSGLQQSQATTAKSARINQQIYNDIKEITDVALELEQTVLNLGVKPQSFGPLQVRMKEFISMLKRAGIRYNVSLDTTINQLNEWMAEVSAAPRTANFGIFKATLEKILSEIVNLLEQTKLVS